MFSNAVFENLQISAGSTTTTPTTFTCPERNVIDFMDFIKASTTTTTAPTINTNANAETQSARHRNMRDSNAMQSVSAALLRQQKETDYDSGTPALEQEMNLARRACWCNATADSNALPIHTRCTNEKCCQHHIQNESTMTTTRTTKENENSAAIDKVDGHVDDDDNDGDDGDDADDDNGKGVGFDDRNGALISAHNNHNNDDVNAVDDNDDDDDDAVDNDDVTTVLNGATFSKNINNLILNDHKHSSITNSNGKNNTITTKRNTKYDNEQIAYIKCDDHNVNDNDDDDHDVDYDGDDDDDDVTEPNNKLDNDKIKDNANETSKIEGKIINANLSSETNTNTTNITNLVQSKLIRRNNINKNNKTTTTINTNVNTTTTTTTSNDCQSPAVNLPHITETEMDITVNTMHSTLATTTTTITTTTTTTTANSANWQAFLLRYWLAFVDFCDKNTIKPNESYMSDAQRRARERWTQQQQQQKQQDKQPKSSTENTTTTTNNNNTNKTEPQLANKKKFSILRSKKLWLVFLVCVFFSCINRIEGRPNRSAYVMNAISGDSINDGAAPISKSIPNVLTARLTVPKESLGGLPDILTEHKLPHKRSAPISRQDDDQSEPHDRYPVAQVDFERVKTPFIISIWILSASIAKIGFHMTPKLHLIFPESCLLIVVGVVIGVVLYFGTEVAVSPLTPDTFFFYMLPPIILDAGYFMPNRLFFDNLGTILLMAVVGTIFNIATIGLSLWGCGLTGIYGVDNTPKFLDTFLFSSLISAVDPVAVLAVFEEIHVNEILYIVVFGESLLNDAVTVVMYHMMEVYNEIGIANIIPQDIVSGVGSFFVVAIGGTVIGIIWGFLTGLVTRFTDHVRVIEPIFIFVMAYLAYLNAEIFHMSGILAITFCGITMKNYVEANISQKSHTTIKYALKMLSSSSETIIFMFLGVATVNNNHVWNTWFVVLTILFCSVYRVIGVIMLTALANRFRLHKLSRVDQFVMSYGGLRGAVAFALVLLVDETVVKQKEMFVTTTIAVIYFTVFVQGITIKPLVKFLNVKRANKRKPTMNERIHERFMDHLMAGIEDIVGKTGNYNVRDKFKRFDNRFIRPLLIRDLKGAEPKIIETYSKLTMRDAMEVMRRNPSTIGQMTATESMSALFRNYTSNCIGGSPSLTNLDNSCSRNLDMHELDYNPSKKDLTDAKIHHLLAEELKPYRRASIQMHRRLSYSRHAVDDRDLSTQVNYKMQMNFRRMFNDRKHHKRSKRGATKQQEGVKQNHVSFHDFQQNGTTKQFSHEENQTKLNDVPAIGVVDDWDDGLTFTAKSSLAENPIPEEDRNVSRDSDNERRVSTPTATESQLPWKRQGDEISDAVQQNEFPAWASNKEYLAYNSPSATFLGGINKPKQPKSVIGLFRRESSGSKGGSSTGGGDLALDGGSDPALAAALGSMPPGGTPIFRLDKRSQSISAASGVSIGEGHAGQFPVTASHRRNVRRGSMLELSGDTIPEETYQHGHSKSLCEPAGDEWDDGALSSGAERPSASTNSERLLRGGVGVGGGSGREPLLPKLTPRAQIRRMGASVGGGMSSSGGSKNQVTTALLSTSNSDYDDDEDEDFDLYDDENIVVTTMSSGGGAGSGGGGVGGTVSGSGGGSGVVGIGGRTRSGSGGAASNNPAGTTAQTSTSTPTTTTTIRLSHNNDESII